MERVMCVREKGGDRDRDRDRDRDKEAERMIGIRPVWKEKLFRQLVRGDRFEKIWEREILNMVR